MSNFLSTDMLEVLIGALCPAFLILSFITPLIFGVRGKTSDRPIALGWVLFLLALIFQDIISPLLAKNFIGRDAFNRIAVDQPGTVAALITGWLPALFFYYIGRIIRYLFIPQKTNTQTNQND